MNELYKILGKLSIDTSDAEGKLDGAVSHAEKSSGRFQSIFQGIGMAIGNMVANGAAKFGQFFSGVDEASGVMKSFASNMELAGQSSEQIKQAQDTMEKYAQSTVYNTTDMLQTVGLLTTSGVQNATDLAKAMGNISSAAADPQQSLKSLSLQMTQVNGKGFIQTMDFRIMQEQASGPMQMVQKRLQELNNWSPAQFQDALSKGKISSDMFNKALVDVGGSASETGKILEKNAMTPKTFGQAWDIVTESMQNALIPVMTQLQAIFIPMITGIGDLSGVLAGALGSAIQATVGFVGQLYAKLSANGAIKSFGDIFTGMKNIVGNVLETLKVFFTTLSGGATSADALGVIANVFKTIIDWINVAIGYINSFFDKLKNSVAIQSLGKAFQTVGQIVGDLVGIAMGFFNSITSGAPSATSVIDNVVGAIKTLADGFAVVTQKTRDFIGWLNGGSTSASALKAVIITLGTAIGGVLLYYKAWQTYINAVAAAQKAWGVITKLGTAIQSAFNIVMGMNPIALVVIAIAALAAGLTYFFTQTKAGQKIWQDFMSWLNAAWKATAQFFTGLWNGIVQTFNSAVSAIKNFVVPIFNTIAAGIQTAMNLIWSVIQIAWQLIKVTFEFIVGGIVAYVKFAWDTMSSIISSVMSGISNIIITVWNAIWGFLQPILSAIGGFFGSVWDGITSAVSSAINNTWSAITNVWNAIWGFLHPILSAIGSFFSNTWNSITSAVSSAVNTASSVISGVWNSISSTVSGIVNGIKSTVTNVWNSITNAVGSAVNAVSSVVSRVWNSISSTVSSVSRSISSTVSSIWNGLTGIVRGAMDAVHNTVSGIINKIKGLFNFNLKFPKIDIPHIPMPHFKIDGEFNPLKGKIPSIGVDWYANGGLMIDPTIFGMNGGNAMAGGEAGPEAILPLTPKVLGGIGEGIAKSMDISGIVEKLDQVIQAINDQDYSPVMVMDGERVGGKLTKTVDKNMGDNSILNRRGVTT